MPCYDRISGSLKKVKTIYDRISGSLKEVKTGYDRISGSLKVYHQSGTPLYDAVEPGDKVEYNGKYYTVIAKDLIVSGDVVLWANDSSRSSTNLSNAGYVTNVANSHNVVQTSPFGTDNTNQATREFIRVTQAGTNQQTSVSITGYGWLLNRRAMGISTSYGSPKIDWLAAAAANRKRYNSNGTAVYHALMDEVRFQEDGNYEVGNSWVNTSGTVQGGNPTASSRTYYFYYAYSVKGTLLCSKNSDGTYTLNI